MAGFRAPWEAWSSPVLDSPRFPGALFTMTSALTVRCDLDRRIAVTLLIANPLTCRSSRHRMVAQCASLSSD